MHPFIEDLKKTILDECEKDMIKLYEYKVISQERGLNSEEEEELIKFIEKQEKLKQIIMLIIS